MSANVDTEPSAEHREPALETKTPVGKESSDTEAAPAQIEEPEAPMAGLRPTVIAIASTALALTLASALLAEPRATVAVAIGGVLATLNFVIFIRLVAAFVSQKGNTAPWAVLAGVKLLGLFATVYIILKRGDLPPLALAIGYGSLPVGISLGSLFKPRPTRAG
jgi:hypothetical protein